MKRLIIGSLAGAIALTLIIVTFTNKNSTDVQGHMNSSLIEPQQPVANEHTENRDIWPTLHEVIEEMKALKAEIADVRSRQSTLNIRYENLSQITQVSRLSSDSNSSIAPDVDSNISEEPIDAESSIDSDQASQEDQIITMDNTLYGQESDPTWDDDAVAKLTDRFLESGFENNRLQDVTCRGVMCRVAFLHNEEDAITELFEREQQLIPWSHKGRVVTTENESGDLMTVMYITRDGHEFPDEAGQL